MSATRFHTRRQWHNLSVWAISSLLFVLLALVIAARIGDWRILIAASAIAVAGVVVTFLHDRSVDSTYEFEGGVMRLWNKRGRIELTRDDIRDASLVDRTAARVYIAEKVERLRAEGLSKEEAKEKVDAFVRFCTVDIGIRSFTFGIGRKLVDTMPNSKQDLVLLRLRNDKDLLLSPEYNQDLMDNISRMLKA